MFGSEILDVAIGLTLVYLLVSLICSALREALEAWFKTRAVYLEQGLREMLRDRDGTGLVSQLYAHPLVYALFRGEYVPSRVNARSWNHRTNLPAYIPASSFAVALLDIVVRGPTAGAAAGATGDGVRISVDGVRGSVATLQPPEVRRAVLAAIDMANGELAQAQANLEAWYNSTMDRVSGWYKRRTQAYVFLIGALIAVAANINTLTIARYLYRDEGARSALVASASGTARDSALRQAGLDTLVRHVNQLELPIGWRHGLAGVRPADAAEQRLPWWASWGFALLGWSTTALAVSLGAPFWFDLLNKIMVVRSTVKPHEKSPEEASEDRQLPASAASRTMMRVQQRERAPGAEPRSGSGPATIDHRELAAQLPDEPAVGV